MYFLVYAIFLLIVVSTYILLKKRENDLFYKLGMAFILYMVTLAISFVAYVFIMAAIEVRNGDGKMDIWHYRAITH